MSNIQYDNYRKHKNKHSRTHGRKNRFLFILVSFIAVAAAVFASVKIYDSFRDNTPANIVSSPGNVSVSGGKTESEIQKDRDLKAVKLLGELTVPDYVDVDYIDVGNARSGQKLTGIHNIVIHYTGNPGTTARQNRSYFSQPDTEVCSHFVVGMDGEIIQCVPIDEQSAASNHRNIDTISIEVCHADKTGKFSSEAYESTVKLAAWLCSRIGLDADDVIRHHDVTGKDCPLYYVKHEDKWEKMKQDIADKITKTTPSIMVIVSRNSA